MHINSLQAYDGERSKLSKRAEEIFSNMRCWQGSFTDREVKERMFPAGDMNMVRPRITEMIKAGIILEVGETKCEATGKTVRLVKALMPDEIKAEPQQELF